MTDTSMAKTTPEAEERQEPSREFRDKVIHGSVTATEYQQVDEALDVAGFRSMSEGVRTLGLLFVRLPALRDLVKQHRGIAA